MLSTHFFALLPLIIMLIISLVFYGKGLVHLLTFGYCVALGWVAILNSWEVLFFPVVLLTGMITIILFIYAMVRGNWL